MKDWTVEQEIHNIKTTTLIVHGRHDTASEEAVGEQTPTLPPIVTLLYLLLASCLFFLFPTSYTTTGAFFYHISASVKWVTFSESSHMPQWEERERYMRVAGGFLREGTGSKVV